MTEMTEKLHHIVQVKLDELNEFDSKMVAEKEKLQGQYEMYKLLSEAFPDLTKINPHAFPGDVEVTLPEVQTIEEGLAVLNKYKILPVHKLTDGTCLFTPYEDQKGYSGMKDAVEPVMLEVDNFRSLPEARLAAFVKTEAHMVKLQVPVHHSEIARSGNYVEHKREWHNCSCRDKHGWFKSQVQWSRGSKEYFPDYTMYNKVNL